MKNNLFSIIIKYIYKINRRLKIFLKNKMNRAFGTGFNRNNINSNNEKNYELRPKFNAKFTKEKVYGIIKAILDEKV